MSIHHLYCEIYNFASMLLVWLVNHTNSMLMDSQILANLFLTQLGFSNIDACVDILYPNPSCLFWLVKHCKYRRDIQQIQRQLGRKATFHLHRCCWRRSRTLLLSFLPPDQPGLRSTIRTTLKQINQIRFCRLNYMPRLWKWPVIVDVKDRDAIVVDMGWLGKRYTVDPPPWPHHNLTFS